MSDAPPALLFVHGAWHGSWCWVPWQELAAASGFTTFAIDLPDHDRPGSRDRIWTTVRDHEFAVHHAVEAIEEPVVIVAHSMGGYIAQRLLSQDIPNLAGVALVASIPNVGLGSTLFRYCRQHPLRSARAIFRADPSTVFRTPQDCRNALFSTTTPSGIIDSTYPLLQNESILSLVEMIAKRIPPARGDVPVLVMSAEDDAILDVKHQRRLAVHYGAHRATVSGGHDVMLDEHSEQAFAELRRWIGSLRADPPV